MTDVLFCDTLSMNTANAYIQQLRHMKAIGRCRKLMRDKNDQLAEQCAKNNQIGRFNGNDMDENRCIRLYRVSSYTSIEQHLQNTSMAYGKLLFRIECRLDSIDQVPFYMMCMQ